MTSPRARYIALIPGALILTIGIAHLFMPSIGYASHDLSAIPEPQRSHFVYLGTYAIGVFLLAMGGLTVYMALQTATKAATVFFGAMAAVWTGRWVLEFLFPVNLRLFFVDDPHAVLRVVIGVIAVAYCIVTAAMAVQMVRMKRL